MYIEMIKKNRETILRGEIGALLHDIGKLHPNFIRKHSIEGGEKFEHGDIDQFMKPELITLFKRIKIEVNDQNASIYDSIKFHHNPKNDILKYLEQCDRKDSADDKGIVRRKQHLDSAWISSPFGYKKEKMDLDCLQKKFDDLQDNLIELFKSYLADIGHLRNTLINTLKTPFSHALGETRIPANDVTLWDHSYSTASLFKSGLAGMVCGAYQSVGKELKWRIFGICWNGVEFINKGKKVAEIQSRNDVIENLKMELKQIFEKDVPVGNAIYKDTNGIYFTFPDLDKAHDLAEECARDALKVIYGKSQNELWPFFILSGATTTLTGITYILNLSSEKRKVPKMTPVLFVEDEEKYLENPDLPFFTIRQSVCPVCGIRPIVEEKKRCEVCNERRKGRLSKWLSSREETIWIDEVADSNNRIALLGLSFYLDKWLNGTMVGTIYSQTFKEWLNAKKGKSSVKESLYAVQNELIEMTENRISNIKKRIKEMKRARDQSRVKDKINESLKEIENLNRKKKKADFVLIPNKETAFKVLYTFFEAKDADKKEDAAKILHTFFEENIRLDEDSLERHLENIKMRIKADELTRENLATFLFTQNPSPARLYRIWRETEEFLDLLVREIRDTIYSTKWKRIRFFVNIDGSTEREMKIESETSYIVRIQELDPSDLLVFHNINGEFYTIESLEKYRFDNKTGLEAIKSALNQGISCIEPEESSKNNKNNLGNLIKNGEYLQVSNITVEEYHPFIEINRSPLSIRLIVPAQDSMKIIFLITDLYNKIFEKVIGKFPLNVKLLVARRKFPLYMLLDAESRMLESEGFKKQIAMNPWWNPKYDEFYGFYPTNPAEPGKKYTLNDLAPISKGKIFHLYPGYFDFDLLMGSTDRYRIVYSEEEKIRRADEDYRLFTGRPYYFYQISEMQELWDILANLTESQVHFIEEMIISKLREWRNVEDDEKENIFMRFAERVLRDAFGNKWNCLREETRWFLLKSAINGLLLDTINLFRRVIE
ncbi:MAG TPA: CRISPR-associated protein Csx11 [Thermotogae bacterium]|nr:CRISPR-associated protein Csx11 [Thermotogota bacterium]